MRAFHVETPGAAGGFGRSALATGSHLFSLAHIVDDLTERIAPCVWQAHVGLHPDTSGRAPAQARRPLYTPEERRRRDSTPWTLVQGILAPVQFLAFGISLALVIRFLMTGEGYVAATVSILIKTLLLYTIMITGSIWEKVVFGKWLFARSFFWEDVFSMLVLALQTAYLLSLIFGWGDARQQMSIAIAAYACYVINAGQFILKLRAARLEAPGAASWSPTETGQLT
jgi:3-vinyl bacteriochlorophyllide hydratase